MITQMPQPRWPFPQKPLEPLAFIYEPQPRLPFANTFTRNASPKKQATFWHELPALQEGGLKEIPLISKGVLKCTVCTCLEYTS